MILQCFFLFQKIKRKTGIDIYFKSKKYKQLSVLFYLLFIIFFCLTFSIPVNCFFIQNDYLYFFFLAYFLIHRPFYDDNIRNRLNIIFKVIFFMRREIFIKRSNLMSLNTFMDFFSFMFSITELKRNSLVFYGKQIKITKVWNFFFSIYF